MKAKDTKAWFIVDPGGNIQALKSWDEKGEAIYWVEYEHQARWSHLKTLGYTCQLITLSSENTKPTIRKVFGDLAKILNDMGWVKGEDYEIETGIPDNT